MITRIWHGRTTAAKSVEYLNLMRTVAIPDYRSTPGNKGAYALRRIEGDTAHFLMVTFWESGDAVRASTWYVSNCAEASAGARSQILRSTRCSDNTNGDASTLLALIGPGKAIEIFISTASVVADPTCRGNLAHHMLIQPSPQTPLALPVLRPCDLDARKPSRRIIWEFAILASI
jgi:heme-degrading monooxygenase HmoA